MSDQQKPDEPGKRGRKANIPPGASPEDFYSILSQGKYMYVPTRRLWDRDSVKRVLGAEKTQDLDLKRACHELTWGPGLPMVVRDKVILNGAWRNKPGANTFNSYCPPDPLPKGAEWKKAEPWVKLIRFLFGKDADHIIEWFAYRVQHPEIKINHCLVLGSEAHGIGKDTLLQGPQFAVGRWNWTNISARKAFLDAADKNSFLKSTILQISEAHDLGEKRFPFYDIMKDWMASPPDTLTVQDKWLLQHMIFNLLGVIITLNHKIDGLFIPPDDRRYYVAWSQRKPGDFPPGYWKNFYNWYERGGLQHVAAYLASYPLELTGFDPKAPPPKTEAWHAIVNANREPAESDLREVLAWMGDQDFADEPSGHLPEAVTIDTVRRWCFGVESGSLPGDAEACADLYRDMGDRRQRRKTAHRFEGAGYTLASNPQAESGMWNIARKRQAVYVRSDVTGRDRDKAVAKLITDENDRAARLVAVAAGAAGKPADKNSRPGSVKQ